MDRPRDLPTDAQRTVLGRSVADADPPTLERARPTSSKNCFWGLPAVNSIVRGPVWAADETIGAATAAPVVSAAIDAAA